MRDKCRYQSSNKNWLKWKWSETFTLKLKNQLIELLINWSLLQTRSKKLSPKKLKSNQPYKSLLRWQKHCTLRRSCLHIMRSYFQFRFRKSWLFPNKLQYLLKSWFKKLFQSDKSFKKSYKFLNLFRKLFKQNNRVSRLNSSKKLCKKLLWMKG